MELNDIERTALEQKLEDPKKNVKCPRCGGIIEHKKIGCSVLVACLTDGCIKKSLRGI